MPLWLVLIYSFSDSSAIYCPDQTLTNLASKNIMENNGWTFRVSKDRNNGLDDTWGSKSLNGHCVGNIRGSVSTIFQGKGFGVLVFENCLPTSEVVVYLNSQRLASALGNRTKEAIGFQFLPGDKLEVTEDFKLHHLSLLCHCMFEVLRPCYNTIILLLLICNLTNNYICCIII